MKLIRSTFALVVIGGLLWFVWHKLQANRAEQRLRMRLAAEMPDFIPVEAAEARLRPLTETHTYHGKLLPARQTFLIAGVQGTVTRLFKRRNDFVRKGEPIAQVDDFTLEARKEVLDAQLNHLRKDRTRLESLLVAEAVTRRQLEEIELGIEKAESDLAVLEDSRKRFLLTAPMDGVLTELFLEEGSFVAGGMRFGELMDVSRLKLLVRVPESVVARLQRGQASELHFEALPETALQGRIERIAPKADFGGKYQVEIELPEKRPELRVGMLGAVRWHFGGREALVIPRKALAGSVFDPRVYVLATQDGAGWRVEERELSIGYFDSEQVEVLNGLQAGERVVVTGHINLQDGSLVRLLPPPNE